MANRGECGVKGWMRLMGKRILMVPREGEERVEAEKDVVEIWETVCRSLARDGGHWIGYVRRFERLLINSHRGKIVCAIKQALFWLSRARSRT